MDEVDRIRAFNRLCTRELGLLERSYRDSGLGVSEVRVLHEIAQGATTAREVALRLGLDEGYLSRTIRGFEQRGWLARERAGTDARRRILVLTGAGRMAAGHLEQRSRARIAAWSTALTAGARAALLDGIATVTGALSGEADGIAIGPLGPGDAGWIIQRHAELYAADEGYGTGFEALVARIVAEFLAGHDPLREGGWLARTGQRRVGSVFVVSENDTVARLRLFLLEPAMRGQGLGRRMLDHALDFARSAGYRRMVLWTHESHRAACALYAANGFSMTEARAAHSFGQNVVEQVWERAL